jgi:hypothetical protein
MNDIFDLFKGIGVIIDDALADVNSKDKDIIWKIKESFDEKNIPILTCSELPSNEMLVNFNSVSFLLLDWELYGEQLASGISKPQTALDDNIDFIRQFNKVCFAPVFIFSNESPDAIKYKLSEAGLYNSAKSNHIFVESKSALHDACSLFSKIKTWIETTPSIYVMKEWEKSLNKAKRDLFWDFYEINPEWAKILYKTIIGDKGNFSYEINEILFENIKTRTILTSFDSNILSGEPELEISSGEIKKVLEGQRFWKHNIDVIFTGDIFLKENKYYINILPQCDCIPRKKGQNNNDIKIYLLGAIKLKHLEKHYDNYYGIFIDNDSQFTVFPVDNGKAIQFDFNQFTIVEFKDWKQYRIGTLLPPFITRLIQRFGTYLQRQGLPKIPKEAIK